MSTSRKTEVADRLRDALSQGQYGPGQRLPGEDEVARDLGVSKATARLGMRILQEEGRLEIVAGRGAFAADHRPAPHLATPGPGGADSERFVDGYREHVHRAGYGPVEEHTKVGLDTMRTRIAKRLHGTDGGNAGPGGLVVVRTSRRYVQGTLWQTQTTWFPYDIARDTPLMAPEHIDRGLDVVLAEHGHHENRHWDVIGARMPDPEEARDYDMGPGIPLLVQERVGHTEERAVRWTETVMPAHRHQLLYAGGEVPEDLLDRASHLNVFDA